MGSTRLSWSVIGVLLLWMSPGFSAVSRTNLALNGTAVQSPSLPGGMRAGPEVAIDGDSNFARNGICSGTSAFSSDPWWRLELPGVYKVSEIVVTQNRRQGEMYIYIGNSLANNGNDNPRCAVISRFLTCTTQTVKCYGMEGRFINFFLPSLRSDKLSLCEVKVYEEQIPSISIQETGRNFTLVGSRLCWSDALLYCRDYHWDLLTLMGPKDQEIIDELVARAPFPLSSHLWVGLHRLSLENSWFWMSGDPVVFTQWREELQHTSRCGGVSSVEPSTWRSNSCGEHLNFICFTGPTEGVNQLRFYSSTREKETHCS